MVYFLGMANVLYGVDADIGRKSGDRMEHLRRLGEVANLMLDAGAILIVSAAGADPGRSRGDEDHRRSRPDRARSGWATSVTTDITCDLVLTDLEDETDSVERIKRRLQDKGVLFRPW